VVCHVTIDTTFRALEKQEVDLVITQNVGAVAADHMEVELLYDERVFVVAATKNPWSRKRRISLADLMNEPWTLPPPDMPGTVHAEAFRAAGLDLPAATVVIGRGIARIALVAKGRFLTLTSETVIGFAGGDMAIKALPIDLPDIRIPVGIVTLKNRTLTPVVQLFTDYAREIARPSARGKSVSARRRQVDADRFDRMKVVRSRLLGDDSYHQQTSPVIGVDPTRHQPAASEPGGCHGAYLSPQST
jgi:DNA-binding transcriptional LysR family regulator